MPEPQPKEPEQNQPQAPPAPPKGGISSEVYAQLPEELKALFSNGGDGYTFQGPEALGAGGKAALERERQAKGDLEKELGRLRSQLEKSEQEALTAKGQELEAKQKRIEALERREKELEEKLTTTNGLLTKVTGSDLVRRHILAMEAYNPEAHGALDAAIEKFIGSKDGQPCILDGKGQVVFCDKTGKEMVGEQWIEPWAASLPAAGFPILKGDVGTSLAKKMPGQGPMGKSFGQLTEEEKAVAYASLEKELGPEKAMARWAQLKQDSKQQQKP